jgi:probable phosphoglycerate mutase
LRRKNELNTILYLIRHGETNWNQSRRIQGHSDIDLNSVGEQQATRLAKRFANETFHAVYASDLSRARETARRIADQLGLPVSTLPHLRERCYGEWEGLTYEEIRQRFQERDEASCGIETFDAMQQRAVSALTELAASHPGEAIVVVSHGGFINSFLHYVTNGEQGTGITRIDNTGVSTFRYAHDRWEVLRVNDTDHLEK